MYANQGKNKFGLHSMLYFTEILMIYATEVIARKYSIKAKMCL